MSAIADRAIEVDSAYEDYAKRLGLTVSADDSETLFELKSKTGRYKLDISVPHAISSKDTYALITYRQEMDSETLEKQITGLSSLLATHNQLKNRGYECTSEFNDVPSISCDVRLKSHSAVIPFIEAVIPHFPREL